MGNKIDCGVAGVLLAYPRLFFIYLLPITIGSSIRQSPHRHDFLLRLRSYGKVVGEFLSHLKFSCQHEEKRVCYTPLIFSDKYFNS